MAGDELIAGHRIRTEGSGGSNLLRAAWICIAISIITTAIGLFWMRLWMVGIVMAGVAIIFVVLGWRASRRARPVLIASICALAFALAPLVAAVSTLATRSGPVDLPVQEVALEVRATGAFTVIHTTPPLPGQTVLGVQTEHATDTFDVAYTTDMSRMQFFIALDGANNTSAPVRCVVTVNGVEVVDKTATERTLDCSLDLHDLHATTG